MSFSIRQKGFTLVEILVVVVIIAIITTASLQLLNSGSVSRTLQHKIHNLKAALNYSCNQSVFQNQIFGLHLYKHGYQFSRFKVNQWINQENEFLPTIQWEDNWEFTLDIENAQINLSENQIQQPQIICYPTGELTKFSITLKHSSSPDKYHLKVDNEGQLESFWGNNAE